MSEQQGERSFEPTEHRREQFRKDGKFARSRDAAGSAGLLAALGALLGSRAEMQSAVKVLFQASHGDLGAIARGHPSLVFGVGGRALLALVGPALVAAVVAAVIIGLAQTGFRINADALAFKPERLDPLPRLQQLFSPKKAAMEALLSALRIGLVAYVSYRVASADLPSLIALARAPTDVAAEKIVAAVTHLLLVAGGAVGAVAIVDYAQSRFRLSQEMRMTRRELMDEMRQNDGDPKMKARLRARAKAMARKRAIQAVRTASVVVTNPTHVAVALRYEESDAAPVVVAKGHDDLALRIRAEARKYGIPILENRPLARALDAEVPVGRRIPLAHFAAVARVLAFVYKLPGARRRGTRRA
jgi:flagellar biosynthetic protein FlhB